MWTAVFMIVKEASYLSLQRRCLLQIPNCTGAVEELALELRGNSIPAHKHGRAQTLQNLLLFLNKSSTVFVILSPLGRLPAPWLAVRNALNSAALARYLVDARRIA